ncbi:MAG: hypothetical protein LBE08_04520 [Bifidobacteriaceae bacterium]|jgi:ribulose-phosphate 3-epimerase|nr:hypothetical protein [Bifidobacteriaceae bacterium]
MRLACSLWNAAGPGALAEARRMVAAGVDLFHWDRSDGTMASPGGFTAAEARGIGLGVGAAAEAHLMLARPMEELDLWLEFCELVVVHVEATDAAAALQRIEAAGRCGGLAVAPGTPLAALPSTYRGPVLVMSVIPGQAGGAFQAGTAARVAALAPRGLVGVDGAVTLERWADLRRSGARWAVSGTDLLARPNPPAWREAPAA